MNKIARNTGDLSKIRMEPAITTVKETKLNKEGSFKMAAPHQKLRKTRRPKIFEINQKQPEANREIELINL